MSNFNQEMTRWTSPTNQAFYALHKNAIGLYHTAAVIVQILWLIFSTRPLANILIEYVPYLATYAVIIAVGVLALFHYVIHELVRYVFYNWLDDDPNTNSSFGTIASLVIMLGGLLALDVLGITSFIRDESKFTTLHTQNETQGSAAAQKRLDVFNADLAVINTAFNQEFEAINTQYAAKINKVQRRRANDDDDRRKKRNEIVSLKAERDAAIGVKKTELAAAQKQLVAEKNAALGNIDKRHNGTREKINTADADNESKAHSYGWIISIFCLITLLFCTYQATVLRVMSGQKPVSRYTIADATGSTTTKLADVLTDAWQRQSHRFLVAFHGLLTTGTSELDEIDGAFILRKKGQQATTSVNPGNDNDLLGGNGGGGTPPTTPPTAPAQPLGGENALRKKAVADAARDMGLHESAPQVQALADAYYKKMVNPTPLEVTNTAVIPVITDITPISAVAQSAPTVAQQNTEKGLSELDDKLERLRSEILKNSSSHFNRGDAKNNSVAKRIFESCDKAYIALKRGGEVTPSVLTKFKEAALDRLDLCASHNIEYDSRDILFHIIEKREA
jgi:hypothetical protein